MAILTYNFYTDFLTIFVACVAVCVAYFKWALNYWKRKGVESPPTKLPAGNAADILLQKMSFGEKVKNIYDEFKSKGLRYCGFYFLAKPIFIVLDPELIRMMLNKDFQHFTDHANYVNEEIDPLSGHLFSLKGLKWKNLRAKITPTFSSGKMKMMFQTLVDCSDELIVVMDNVVTENKPVDIKDVIGRFMTDVIGSCAFGLECNSLRDPDSKFREYGKKVFEVDPLRAIKSMLSLCLPGVLTFFNVSITRKDVTEFFMNVVNETVKYREENNIVRKDFMHLLIQLKNNIKILDEDSAGSLKSGHQESKFEVGKTLSMPELAAQAYVFFLGGFETSSTTLTFCLYELVINPEIQDNLRQEINKVLENHDGKITYDALINMTYMDKCINETLRKYPPIPLLIRECTKTYKIPDSDVVLGKGAPVFIPVLGMQHDPEYYPNPEKFDPERFSPQNKAKRHAFTWLPFGEGPRACIGIRFGIMQTKASLTILLKNYKFSLNPKTKVPLDMNPKSFVLSVKDIIWLNTQKIRN